MVFNSLEFAVFLAIVLILYFGVVPASLERVRKLVLLIASYVFYASWNPSFTLLLFGSTILDYSLGLRMANEQSPLRRRWLLGLSLLGNLGVLGFFKYGGFLREQFQSLAVLFGMGDPIQQPWNIVLPVGISFYTFQTLSYSIDVYRGVQPPTRSLLDFALFVSFFPQLVAGPIVRSKEFLPQLEGLKQVRPDDVEEGLVRIFAGLLKKVVLADTLGEYVDEVFASVFSYQGPNLLLAIYAYAFQIYFDFSGYSDLAIGLAQLFGFRISDNFNRPYLATSPREFWQRWHISLSTWLRDYLYISLGGNRGTTLRTYVNLALTMLLGGLWHGASWNFVIWGAFHGTWLAAHRFWTGGRSEASTRWLWLKRFATFHVVCVGWVFFRAETLEKALLVFSRLPSWEWISESFASVAAVLLAISITLHLSGDPRRLRRRYRELPASLQGLGYGLIAVLVFLFSPSEGRFIYFQF
jgi:D-alanyl-lipoteichoic acid acyltransferase DltB (MBOAT superfamily)